MLTLENAVLLSVVLLSQVEISVGAFHSSSQVEISKNFLIGRFKGVSGTSCLHRCRRNTSCHQAAMQGPDCLLLRDGSESKHNDGEMMAVTMLTKIRKIVGETQFTYSTLSIISHTPLARLTAHTTISETIANSIF